MRAALYARVSTDNQRGNYSIPSQIQAMLEYAGRKGYTIVGDRFVNPKDGQDAEEGIPAFVDDFSSTELQRPAFDACLSYLEKYGFDVLLVHAIDRLARDPFNRQVLEREVAARSARVEYILGNYDESPEGEVRKDLDATFAKWENAKRVERINRGKKRKAEMGKFVSGKTSYGYLINKEAEGGLEVYEPEAAVVQQIFQWYIGGLSVYQIVRELKKREIKTQDGRDEWADSTVASLLKNTTYIGYLYYNKKFRDKNKKVFFRDKSEWIRIECTPIIPTEIFEAAQEKLKANRVQLRKRPKKFFLLSGIIFCSQCNHAYSAFTTNTSQGYRHRASKWLCWNKVITRGKIEPKVWEKVSQILLDPGSLRRGYEKMMAEQREKEALNIRHLEAIHAGIEKLHAKKNRLQAVYLDPEIGMSKEEYLGEKRVIEDQIKSTQEDIERIEKELSHIPSDNDLVALEELSRQIVEALGENLDIPGSEKRRILELLNIKVLLSPNGKIKLTGFFYPQTDGVFSNVS
jgi:site-specific DNA recombinase